MSLEPCTSSHCSKQSNPPSIKSAILEAPPSSQGSSIDPANPEEDFLRHLQIPNWSQAKRKLLKLQEAAVERGDVESLLRYDYWEQCVAKKHQQLDFSYKATADWRALDRIGRKLLDKNTERMTKLKIATLIKNSFDVQEAEDSAVDSDDIIDEDVYDFWDDGVENY